MNVAKLAPYSKAIVAVAGALVVTATAIADASVSPTEVGLIATAWATAVGVFAKSNS